jgi:GH24 family phage-related lysozyme (muramidase)
MGGRGFGVLLCRRGIGLLLACVAVRPVAVGQSATPAAPKLSARSEVTSPTASIRVSNRQLENRDALLPLPAAGVPAGLEPLFALSSSDIKFSFTRLTEVLRDKKHEGWVLAAYPDPKTSDPLIGAGFTLSLPAREHPQSDPLNPYRFLEPSSEQLWQAAGFDTERLQVILTEYQSNLEAWGTRKYRKKIRQLPDQVSEDEALSLLRVAEVQAIHNARAYCRSFDQLTASQQMALTQLVYQMGVNLEEFSQFLGLINQGSYLENTSYSVGVSSDRAYWQQVQESLIHSQWARKYSTRAICVIAMFDPDYPESPSAAERRVKATLRPAKHHHKKSKSRSARA